MSTYSGGQDTKKEWEKGLWSKTSVRGKGIIRKKGKNIIGGKEIEVAVVTVCQQGFVCQDSKVPRYYSQLAVAKKTRRFTHTYTYSVSLCSHIHTLTLGRQAVSSHCERLSPLLFLIVCPYSVYPNLPLLPYLFICFFFCVYLSFFVAGGSGDSLGSVWPIH